MHGRIIFALWEAICANAQPVFKPLFKGQKICFLNSGLICFILQMKGGYK